MTGNDIDHSIGRLAVAHRRAVRGRMMRSGLCGLITLCGNLAHGAASGAWQVAVFEADITCPIGHPLMGGGIAPASEVVTPLLAKGMVLLGPDKPVVVAALDWCEVRNDAYDRWREALAEAAGTNRERVILSSVHVHDAPVADLYAQRLLDEAGQFGSLIDAEFFESSVRKTADALRGSLAGTRPVTGYGIGRAEVKEIASNRRVRLNDGTVGFHRGSMTLDEDLRSQPAGEIDPWLRVLSFWDGDTPVAGITVYAVHPMSYYGQGGVSHDFPGIARERLQEANAGAFQIYMSGCSGDVTAGKWYDDARENRMVLADKLYGAMTEAWKTTVRHPLDSVSFRNTALRLAPINAGNYTKDAMRSTLANAAETTFRRNQAAMGLSWVRRVDSGQPIDLPALDFGKAVLVLMPAEAFVGYQAMAQAMRPDSTVLTPGYGECAPGYITTDAADADHFEDNWRWVGDGSEALIRAALDEVLRRPDAGASAAVNPR